MAELKRIEEELLTAEVASDDISVKQPEGPKLVEKQWDRGDNVSAEDLRIALQRYRSFYDRLLRL